MPWNPDLYHKFQSERAAPFYDLLALVDVRPNLKVIDLGCGSGELTRQLADKLPGSHVTGLDSSPQMLDKAASFVRPGLVFQQGDQSTLTGEWDLIFSNAALQWSANHAELIPYLFDKLSPSGQIVVQPKISSYSKRSIHTSLKTRTRSWNGFQARRSFPTSSGLENTQMTS